MLYYFDLFIKTKNGGEKLKLGVLMGLMCLMALAVFCFLFFICSICHRWLSKKFIKPNENHDENCENKNIKLFKLEIEKAPVHTEVKLKDRRQNTFKKYISKLTRK